MSDNSRHPLAGIFLSLAAAASFACNTALASVAYAHGATPMSVLTYRACLAAIVLFAILLAMRVKMTLPPRQRWAALGLGLLVGSYSYGLLGAVAHMPVALAVLSFYVYPLIVGLVSWALGRERMTPALGVALVVAFAGLFLALDVGGGRLSPAGFGLAFGGALLFTLVILVNNALVGGADSRPVSLHMLTVAAAFYLLIDLVLGEFPLPQGGIGVAAFLGVGVFYTFSIISMFIAVSWIGPARTSLTMNFEPITSVFLGTVVLGQAMAPLQFLGAALVIASILFVAWMRAGTGR
jgi:drug/metabolite transporter (DMT)-like permease